MPPLKCLLVFHADGQWFGSEVEWARSGSGWYRQTTGIPIPQSPEEIERFAAENGYRIEWQNVNPHAQAGAETDSGASVSSW